MNPPVEPMSIKTHFFVRIIRYLLLIVTMCPIAYFFFRDESWGGFTLSILGIIFWLVEITRGNQTEDYIIENYENPLQ